MACTRTSIDAIGPVWQDGPLVQTSSVPGGRRSQIKGFRLQVGSAPVSYGVYGAEAGRAGASPAELLASIADAGFEGSELGPPGFFGGPEQTAARFYAVGLKAIGAYVPVHFALDDRVVASDLERMATTCEELVACGGGLVILADEGDEVLLRHPARPWADRSLALSVDQWQVFARRVEEAIALAERYGLSCSFHPHISTYVESPWEVERLLEHTRIGLTLDTGHIQLAGADPAECERAWRGRINHVHLKDVRVGVLARAKAEHRRDFDIWWADVATPLGRGDVDIDGFVGQLLSAGYGGWLVVEQDRAPTTAQDYPAVAAVQAANRRWLEACFDRLAGRVTGRNRAAAVGTGRP
jgi:inosose dehydratase